MAIPDVTITLMPEEGGAIVYGSLAAKSSIDPPTGELVVIAIITNNEPSPIVVSQATISFVGSPSLAPTTFTLNPVATVPPGWTHVWSIPSVILPESPPAAAVVTLSFDGFEPVSFAFVVFDPITLPAMPLAKYASTATGGGYAFPAKSSDLRRGEFWTGMSAIHGLAYDLHVKVFSTSTNNWESLPPGADNSENSNYYVWGKPIYAIADGLVVQFKDGIEANTPPGWPSTVPENIYEGNHFYIQHGAASALYAHFQAGKMSERLKSVGATVVQGELLGLAGNSGHSSQPHLHVHLRRGIVPDKLPTRPLHFSGIQVLDLAMVNPDTWPPTIDDLWNAVSAQGLPSVDSAIWPGPLSDKALSWAGRTPSLVRRDRPRLAPRS